MWMDKQEQMQSVQSCSHTHMLLKAAQNPFSQGHNFYIKWKHRCSYTFGPAEQMQLNIYAYLPDVQLMW